MHQMSKYKASSDLSLPRQEFPHCKKCYEDGYDVEHASVLYYCIYKQYPKWIQSLENQHVKKKKKTMIRWRRKAYAMEKCQLGNFHLVNRQGKAIPMLKETLEVLIAAHSHKHNSSDKMKQLIYHQNGFDKFMPAKFLHGFIQSCQQCCRKNGQKLPIRLLFRENIFDKIKEIPFTQKFLQEEPMEDFRCVSFDFKTCPYDCENDTYEAKYIKHAPFFLYGKLPSEDIQVPCRTSRQYRDLLNPKIAPYHSVSLCQKGTIHIWKAKSGMKPEVFQKYSQSELAKLGFKRIPMKNQVRKIFETIHRKMGHLTFDEMIQVLKETPYHMEKLRAYLNKGLDFCEKCKNFNSPKTEEYPKDTHSQLPSFSTSKKTKSMFSKLGQNGVNYQFYEDGEENISICACSTSKMRQNYNFFGDSVYFQEISDLNTQWRIFILTGLSNMGEIVMFCLVAVSVMADVNFFTVFEIIFKVLKCKVYPLTLHTCLDEQVCGAIESFICYSTNPSIRKIHHLVFEDSLMNSLLIFLNQESQTPILIKYFSDAIRTDLQREFFESISQIQSQIENTEVFLNMINLSSRLFLSLYPEAFCGVGFLKERTKHLKEKIRSTVSAPIIKILETVEKLQETLTFPRAPKPFPKSPLLHQNFLRNLKEYCSHHIIVQISKNIKQSERLSATNINETLVKIHDQNKDYMVKYSLQFSYWICQCRQIYRDGIPCRHILFLLRNFQGSILYYISSRWHL